MVVLNDTGEKELLVFMHIPKTGGSTLRRIIARQYQLEEIWTFGDIYKFKERIGKFSREQLTQIKCLQGHACFGKVDRYFTKPCTYITMLRKPVDRIISLYYYIINTPGCHLYDQVKDLKLKEFIMDKKFVFSNKNTQTRYVSGGNPPNLEKAKKNLDKYFSIVGLTEFFDISTFLMKEKFSWDNIDYNKKVNVTKNRPTKEELSKEVIDIIEEKNKLDIQLYDHAKKNLQKKIQNLNFKSK